MDTKATIPVRIYPSTHKRLKIRGAELGWTLAQLIDYAESVMPHAPTKGVSLMKPPKPVKEI